MSNSKKEKEKYFYDKKPIDIRKKMEIVIGGSHQVENVAPPPPTERKRIFVPIPNMEKVIPMKKDKDFRQRHFYHKYDKTPYPTHPGRNRVSYDLDEEDFEYVELNTRDHDVKNFYNVELFFDILEKETGFDKSLVPLEEIQKKYEDDLQYLTPRVQKQLYEYWKKKRVSRVEFSDDFDYPVGRPLTQQFFLSPTLENQNSRVPFRRIRSEQETGSSKGNKPKKKKRVNKNVNSPRLKWKEDRISLDRLRDLENLLEKLKGIVMIIKRKEEMKRELVKMQETYLKEMWREEMRKRKQMAVPTSGAAPTPSRRTSSSSSSSTSTSSTSSTTTDMEPPPIREPNQFSFGYLPKRRINVDDIEEEEELIRSGIVIEDEKRRKKQPNQHTYSKKNSGFRGRSKTQSMKGRGKYAKQNNLHDPIKNPDCVSFRMGEIPVRRYSHIPHNPPPPHMVQLNNNKQRDRRMNISKKFVGGRSFFKNHHNVKRFPIFAFMCDVQQTRNLPKEEGVQGRECFIGRGGRVFFIDKEEEEDDEGGGSEDDDEDEDDDEEADPMEDEEKGRFGA